MLVDLEQIFKSGLSKFFKDSFPQSLLSPLLNTLSHLIRHSNVMQYPKVWLGEKLKPPSLILRPIYE